MTWSQVDDIAADGNEIGGHTAHHIDARRTPTRPRPRQVCKDRVNLLDRGYRTHEASPIRSARTTPPSQSIVRNCGYNSARTTNQFVPPPSETMPPQDPFAIRVVGQQHQRHLATLKST